MTRANNMAGFFIVLVAALSPIPFGSNRPFFWALSGALVGIAAIVFFLLALRNRDGLRVPLERLRPYLIAWCALSAWLVLQVIPFGSMFGGFALHLPAGGDMSTDAWSVAPNLTWLMLMRTTSYGLVFLLAVQAGANAGRAKFILTAVFWALVLHAGFALVQLTQLGDTILGFPKSQYAGVATGTFVNRNSFATFLSMGLAIGAALLPDTLFSPKARNHSRLDGFISAAFLLAGMLVLLLALLSSASRMGLFAGLCGMLAVGLLALRSFPQARSLFLGALVVSAVAGGGALWIFGQGTLERIIDLGGSTTGRLNLYEQVVSMIAERALFGYGGGTFEIAFPSFFGPPLNLTMLYDKAHSTYLTIIAELGIIGATFVIIPVALALFTLMHSLWTAQDGSAARLAATGAIVVTAVHSTVDFSLEIQANAYLLAVITGVGIASTLINTNSRSAVPAADIYQRGL